LEFEKCSSICPFACSTSIKNIKTPVKKNRKKDILNFTNADPFLALAFGINGGKKN